MTKRGYGAKHNKGVKKVFASLALTAAISLLVVNAAIVQFGAPCKSALSSEAINETFSTQPSIQSSAATLCNRSNYNISWFTWFFEASKDASFHYLDLLELLNREG